MSNEAENKYLKLIDDTIAQGPYRADWDSLSKAPVPAWFDERRLGIFTHFGVYSVPAFNNEWYSRNMYIKDSPEYEHHIATYGPHKDFGYKDFIPMFKAERFDAGKWLDLFKEAGAGYYCPVAEHHDGFQMYESELSHWNAKEMGPCRDVIGELKAAAEERDVVFCTSTHRAEHSFFMGGGKEFESDIKDPMQKGDFYWPSVGFDTNTEDLNSSEGPSEEYFRDWMARTAEIIVKYRPKFLYFDWWIQHGSFKPYLKKLAAFYYNLGKQWGEDVIICYKHDAFAFGSGIVEVERGSFPDAKPYRWQTDTAAARNSWCYVTNIDYKESVELIWNLVDIVSKNGNMMLNIGPRADGTIPEGDEKLLRDLGAWMKVNSEMINGSRVWRVSEEGPTRAAGGFFQDGTKTEYTSEDFRFTTNHGCIYAACMKCPEDGQFFVKSFHDSYDPSKRIFHGLFEKVEVLGFDGAVTFEATEEGLRVSAPGVKSEFPVVLKIQVK